MQGKSFLPSKQFVAKFLIVVIMATFGFSVYKVVTLIKNRAKKDSSVKLVEVIQKVQDDSNNNGIPDWEERLWGLDPKKSGPENKEFIVAKRKALNPNADLSSYEENLSENESLNREFFAVVMALQQTGELDQEAMEAISSAYSQEIESTPIDDIYTKDMLKTTSDSPENTIKYYDDLQNLIKKYQDKDIGSELGMIIQGIAYNDPQVLYAVQTIATAYRNFGQDLVKIPVPESLVDLDLAVANNYEKTAQSVYGMTQLFDDPIIAMRSIINYKKYNDALALSLELLSYVFSEE